MKWENYTKFKIKGLNQEKILNDLCRKVDLVEIERHSKNDTTFKCPYFSSKKVEKLLKEKNVEIVAVEHEGILFKIKKLLTSYGFLSAIVLFFVFYIFQSQFIFQYEINGVDKVSQTEIVQFLDQNYPKNKHNIDTQDVEIGLLDKFPSLSFASCIVKGQTLVVNVKEKLLPDEMFGSFSPIVATKDAKITQINIISGTANVKVGDFVRVGNILVFPYVTDTAGDTKKVEAKAQIVAEVYNEGSVDHYEKFIKVTRTGRTAIKSDVTLFGLSIYSFDDEKKFDMCEVEYEEVSLAKNLFLPFKMKKTIYYELSEEVVETDFEDVKEEYIEKAREKALENCESCDTIIDEYYTLRHLSGVTIVNYCVVTNEQIGGYGNGG